MGRQALADHPDRIDMKVLEGFPAYVEFRDRTRNRESTAEVVVPPAESDATPQDLLDQAVKENRAVVESELLQRALALPPVGFEDLVMKLLAAMGYGHSGRVERTSAAGDAVIEASSARTRSGSIASTSRRSATRPIRSSIARRSRPSLAR